MTGLVIDASVAVKWVVDEPGTREALALRRNNLFAPDLLMAERANILWKKTRLGELAQKRRSTRLACCSAPISSWRRCGPCWNRRRGWRSHSTIRPMIAPIWRWP